MAGVAHVYPNATLNIAKKLENWTTTGTQDTLSVGLIASPSGGYTWNGTSQGHTTVANFLAGSGSGALTEVAGPLVTTGYGRLNLSSITFTTTGLVNTLSCATISWTAVTNWSAYYAFFYDGPNTTTNDATTNELITYWDFGGVVSVVAGGNFTLTINASGVVTYTSS